MNRNELTPDLIKQLNQNNPEINQVKTIYCNEYGDIIPSSDPSILKYRQYVENGWIDDGENEPEMEDIWNDYVIKFKQKRDYERQQNNKKKKESNTILDAFKMLCGVK